MAAGALSICSFGGYDTIKDAVLVGPLQGNFLASFAVGWGCTTVRDFILYTSDFFSRVIAIGCLSCRLPARHYP